MYVQGLPWSPKFWKSIYTFTWIQDVKSVELIQMQWGSGFPAYIKIQIRQCVVKIIHVVVHKKSLFSQPNLEFFQESGQSLGRKLVSFS